MEWADYFHDESNKFYDYVRKNRHGCIAWFLDQHLSMHNARDYMRMYEMVAIHDNEEYVSLRNRKVMSGTPLKETHSLINVKITKG